MVDILVIPFFEVGNIKKLEKIKKLRF